MLRFEVSSETLASFREAVAQLRREAGEHLDDDAMLLLLARRVLGGPTDDGRASYQVAVDVCEDCQRARQVADGEVLALSSAASAMVECDVQRVSAHVGGNDNRGAARAAQDVSPATRRAVMRRDRRRCQVPGCAHSTYVDIHHVVARSDGGAHDASNLVTLCGAHHRAVHEGKMTVTGSADVGISFYHADGTPYGARPSAPMVLVQTQAFQALRGLGFGEREVRAALARAMGEPETSPELEPLLRRCLALLSERASG